jgi:hypothetical protein
VTEEHFAWLTLQCEQMGTRKRQLIFNALKEWLSRTDPSKLPTKGLSEHYVIMHGRSHQAPQLAKGE